MTTLTHDLIYLSAEKTPDEESVVYGQTRLSYRALADEITEHSSALLAMGLSPTMRVAVYLEKRIETVITIFSAMRAGGIAVPINPLLKPGRSPTY